MAGLVEFVSHRSKDVGYTQKRTLSGDSLITQLYGWELLLLNGELSLIWSNNAFLEQ